MSPIRYFVLILMNAVGLCAAADDVTGTISGVVVDATSGEPLDMAAVAVSGKSAYTDDNGYFSISGLTIGRHDVTVSYLGYSPVNIQGVLVGSAHVTPLDIKMTPVSKRFDELIVTHDGRSPVNSMALAGGNKLNMAETSLYAGSLDDPGRMAATVAGIATDVSHNGLSIHGIAPHLMQWRLEGVEIPNPNHYADIATLGGGVLSSLSNFVLGNSDFYAGASPAQYVNALSGVFDMHLRNGNNHTYQHAFQVGILGLDAASEGPIGKPGGASYVFNYRYSATGLLENLKLMDAGGNFNYQDLNFKINLPTHACGEFGLWGTMFIDKYKDAPGDPAEWIYVDDGQISSTDQWMIATGLTHRIRINNGQLSTSLAMAHSSNEAAMEMAQPGGSQYYRYIDADKRQTDLIFTINYLTEIISGWTSRNGINQTEKFYDLRLMKAQYIGMPMTPVNSGKGHTSLVSAYTDNVIKLSSKLELGAGLNLMWLTLNNRVSLQPRLSAKWRSSGRLTLSAATGLYSRMENMDVYFTSIAPGDGCNVNRDLGFTRSFQSMVSASIHLGRHFSLSLSPFYHYLYDVPCGTDDSYSILNCTNFYIDRELVNKGKGRTYGIDFSIDRTLADGWYGKLATSLFNARYCGGDGVWHDTRFNRKYIVNLLGGKEWKVGHNRNNIINVNGRITLQGGDRYSPVDLADTAAHPDKEVQYDETRAYSEQHKPMVLFSFSVSYRINRKHVSHVFALDLLNAGGYSEPYGHGFNLATGVVDILKQKTSLPNLFYRIEF